MIKTNVRHTTFFCASVVLFCSAGDLKAQWWGTNATPCSNGHCAPATPYGYFPTRWHQWPGAVYPDMARPTPAGEEIPPSRVEVPPQNRELEIQTPSTQPPAKSTETPDSSEPMPAPTMQPAPGLQPMPLKPTEEPAQPSFREVPGSSGPSIQQPLFTPQGGSSSSLRNRLRGVVSEGFAAAGVVNPNARLQAVERNDTSCLTITRSGIARGNAVWTSTPDQEPELIVPSLASRPLASEPVEIRSESVTGANPLRAEMVGPSSAGHSVVPATAIELAAREPGRASVGSEPASPRANPLRD